MYDYIYSQFLSKEDNSRHKASEKKEKESLDDSDKRAAEKLFEALVCEGSSTEIEDQGHSWEKFIF